MLQFLHSDLWGRLEELSAAAKRSHVAVAYLAKGASKLLTLRANDILVVDMGDASVKAGRTDPKEVSKYLAEGVQVFSVENLHAKVFVFDDTVIVGSANVSNHSKRALVEAGIETTNAAMRSEAIAWVRSLALAPVTPTLASAKAKLYKPPKWGSPFGGSRRGGKRRSSTQPDVARLWLTNAQPAEFSSDEDDILEEQADTAKRFLKSKKKYTVETIRYQAHVRFAREAELGDLVILIHNVGNTTEVYPPARVLYTRAYKADGVARIGVHLESRSDAVTYYWGRFRKAALGAGVKVGKHSNREISDPEMKESLLRFFRKMD